MPRHVYADVKTLMKSIGSHELDSAGGPAGKHASPEAAYVVNDCPVAFVVKRLGKDDEKIYLKRLDWKTLGIGQRFRAILLSLIGLSMRKRTTLSAAERQAYRFALNRLQQHSLMYITGQERALARLQAAPIDGSAGPSQPVAAGAGKAVPCPRQIAKLHDKIVEEFSHRLRGILPALREQFIHQPSAVAQEAARKTLRPIRDLLRVRLQACQRAGMGPGECNAIVRELGMEQCIDRWTRVSTEHAHPATRTNAMSLAQVDYCLGEMPTLQRHIDMTADAVLGDLHGNGRLLLHSLVSLGFATVNDADAWNAVCAQLASLDTDAPDNDWKRFAVNLAKAIEPADNARERRLTLIGDILADRCGNDMFMATILASMDAWGMDYECILGNHECEFLSYFQAKRNQWELSPPVTAHPMAGMDIGMDELQAASLYRLNALLAKSPQDCKTFQDMIERGFLKHLKVVSFSRDGEILYSHGVANGSLLSGLFTQAGVSRNRFYTEQVRELNAWFLSSALFTWHTFSRVYHTGQWPGQPAPVSPLRAIAWNIGMDLESYGDTPQHPSNAGLSLPDPRTRYAVHGHCEDAARRVTGVIRRTEQLERTLARFAPLTDTRKHFLTGVRDYLPALNEALAVVDAETSGHVIDVLAPFVARRLAELRAQPATQELIRALRENTPPRQRAQALASFWNEHGGAGKAPRMDFDRWGTALQATMIERLLGWYGCAAEGPSLDKWSTDVSAELETKRQRATSVRSAFTRAIRQNLPQGGDIRRESGPLTQEEQDAYVQTLYRRSLSIDGYGGASPKHDKFSRLVHLVPRRTYDPRHASV